ncbi:hypothetical protein LPJ53_001262 [Coemansia erecta]|uniref:PSP proline-rich domain-containing protein n=1 Tax=Coemansia erecta TaxID=147472 RepID=A0A9W7Y4Q7_9FUNG|nr:hypothetical protein LPJ53_001262 [Coemansia erecta]
MALDETQITAKNSSGKQRRKKKSRKDKLAEEEARTSRLAELIDNPQSAADNVKVEYVEAKEPALENPEYSEYSSVFSLFSQNAERSFGARHESPDVDDEKPKPEPTAMDMDSDKTDSDAEMSDAEQTKASRKLRKQQQISVAELKQKAPRPEVVEWTDVSAKDPLLLVTLKATRNTVPVPSHWSQKKKYLQYKRGQEKPQFELPDFIKATGIMEMRETATEDVKAKTAARERMRPKMNKLTLDYQRLHDAFFKFQTKPANITGHGDLYYEGKENETTLGDEFTPGAVSQQLRDALGVPPLAPMPWLLNMQRHGMPPSYQNMKLPGLNAPIPKGAQWGFHPGGWGRPPVDEYGRPLYGDVFAEAADGENTDAQIVPKPGPRKHWGDLEILESSDEEEEEDEDESDAEEDVAEEQEEAAHAADEGEPTEEQHRSGIATIPSGLETPSVLQLRKQTHTEENRQLYSVLPEQATAKLEGIMGSQFTYDMTNALNPSKGAKGEVNIAIDAEELDGMDQDALKEKYDEATGKTKKRKRATAASNTAEKKKTKDFKF